MKLYPEVLYINFHQDVWGRDYLMENERYQRGFNKFMEYTEVTPDEKASNKITDPLEDIVPDLRRFIIEFAYGDIYSRPGLDNKSRALITISSLVTQGAERQIKVHINRGITAGLTPVEIVESIMQLIPYTGFPRVQNALLIAKETFIERNLM